MKKPLLVSVSGIEGVGVGVACERVARSLNKMGINTVVVELGTPRKSVAWEDSYILGSYDGVDVVLLKRHGFTHTAVNRRLSPSCCIWKTDSVRPHFACLLTCNEGVYAERNNISLKKIKFDRPILKLERLKYYNTLEWCHWGTKRIYVLDTSGKYGRLRAAGNIKRLILKELSYVKNAVA